MQIENQIASRRWRSGRANSNHIPCGTANRLSKLHPTAALDMAALAQPLAERAQAVRKRIKRLHVEEPDHPHRLLLRFCCNRPCRRRAADEGDELAPSHELRRFPVSALLPLTLRKRR